MALLGGRSEPGGEVTGGRVGPAQAKTKFLESVSMLSGADALDLATHDEYAHRFGLLGQIR